MLKQLSGVPFLKALNFGLVTILIVGNRQRQRMLIQGRVSAIFAVLANVVVVASIGLVGVPWAYTASEALLLVGYGTTVAILRFRRLPSRRTDAIASDLAYILRRTWVMTRLCTSP